MTIGTQCGAHAAEPNGTISSVLTPVQVFCSFRHYLVLLQCIEHIGISVTHFPAGLLKAHSGMQRDCLFEGTHSSKYYCTLVTSQQ